MTEKYVVVYEDYNLLDGWGTRCSCFTTDFNVAEDYAKELDGKVYKLVPVED